jgi:hypothetical protein
MAIFETAFGAAQIADCFHYLANVQAINNCAVIRKPTQQRPFTAQSQFIH